MSTKLSKLLTGVTALIGLIGLFFFVRIVAAGDEALATDADIQSSILSPFVAFSTFLLWTTIGVTIVFSLWSLVKKPEKLKKTLINVAILAVVLTVAYMLASEEAVTDTFGNVVEGGAAGSSNKWVGTGIIFSMMLGAVGLAFFMLDLLKGFVK